MSKQMYDFVIKNNILPNCQSGFRKKFSTASAMCHITDNLFKARDESLVGILILLDYSKAFDTINHKLLIAKLKYYGFSDTANELVKSYLTDRTQCVKVNNTLSSQKSIGAGVPQGSIIGPLLFIIYTAKILEATEFCKIQAYADDTQLFHTFKTYDLDFASYCINSDLKKIYKCSKEHNLLLNAAKTKVLIFSNSKDYGYIRNNINLKLCSTKLSTSDEAVILGVTLDNNLNFLLMFPN